MSKQKRFNFKNKQKNLKVEIHNAFWKMKLP